MEGVLKKTKQFNLLTSGNDFLRACLLPEILERGQGDREAGAWALDGCAGQTGTGTTGGG